MLAEEGVALESPQDLERALDERPALRESLEAAAREAAAAADEEAEVAPLLAPCRPSSRLRHGSSPSDSSGRTRSS